MIDMRKLIIGLVAMVFVVMMFFSYAIIVDTAPIEAPPKAESGDVTKQTLGTDARAAKDARFFNLDPITKEVTRIIGFKNLLNPGMKTSRWQVENPFLIFYESDYDCRVDADEGIFQVEPGSSNTTPKDARLKGNVVIHVMPKPGSGMSETFIKMDDLTFSSERSEFATDGPVSIKSDQVELTGFGLILFFDTAAGRIDYLNIRDLETLRIFNVTDSGSIATEDNQESSVQTPPLASASTQPPDNTAAMSEDAGDSQTVAPDTAGYYRCIVEDNVEIEYGDELIVTGADQINIENILISTLADSDTPSSAPAAPSPVPAADPPPEPIARETEIMEKQTQVPKEPTTRPSQRVESATEVVVRCDGGIILKPMQDETTGPVSGTTKSTSSDAKIKFKQDVTGVMPEVIHTASGAISETALISGDPPPAKFEAWKIDYDLQTGSGLAHGPVRLTFYQSPDPNNTTAKPWIPVVITADDNTQFIPDESQTVEKIIFNKNVMVTRRAAKPEFTQLDNFHGNKLTVFLDKNEDGDTDISNISMTDGKVYAQSQKLKAQEKLSNVRLSCAEIHYDQTDDEMIAKGPGEIRLSNTQGSDTDASAENAGVDFSKPCYVFVEGFDSIQWDLAQEKIIADGQQDQLKIAYIPLVNGKPEKYVFVDSIQFELSFMTNSAGESELKRVFTDKSIVYKEQNASRSKTLHTIIGQTLEYDTVDGNGWVKIEGTPAMPVNVDGARMPFVYVHPITGEVETKLSTTPGVFKVNQDR
jgi:hypothetical protein